MDHTTLFKVICGSHLYGLDTPESDIDYGSVLMEPMSQVFGITQPPSLKHQVSEEEDNNRFWLRGFAYLCFKGNPNAIEWLWAPLDKMIECDSLFRAFILGNADAFLGLDRLTKSHFGFARSQIIKMRDQSGKVGTKRKNLVRLYGYDTKFASHAIRLMHQLQQLVLQK